MKYRYSYTTSDDLINVNIDRIEINNDKEKIDLILSLVDIVNDSNITIDCKKLTDLIPCQGYRLIFRRNDINCEIIKDDGFIKITTNIINGALIQNLNNIILLANLILIDSDEDRYI